MTRRKFRLLSIVLVITLQIFLSAAMVSKIAIFGGTGMTGKCVTEYALEKGNYETQIYQLQFYV